MPLSASELATKDPSLGAVTYQDGLVWFQTLTNPYPRKSDPEPPRYREPVWDDGVLTIAPDLAAAIRDQYRDSVPIARAAKRVGVVRKIVAREYRRLSDEESRVECGRADARLVSVYTDPTAIGTSPDRSTAGVSDSSNHRGIPSGPH